jgi:simple sugar transport system permease protein
MRLEILKRPEPSRLMIVGAPLLAILLTLITGAIIFIALGKDPLYGLYVFYVEPLTALWTLEELAVKAVPLVLIALGLSLCYRANAWNIGAEGQFTLGAITGAIIPVYFPEWNSWLVLPLMLLLGAAGGMLWASIPAYLRVKFGASEILTSLMLVYVAQHFLDWLLRGPFRNPNGFNYGETRIFQEAARVPILIPDTRVRIGLLIALVAVPLIWFLLRRTFAGFAVDVVGEAPRAARFGGFSRNRVILGTFMASGALAGLAGILEAAGPLGQLKPVLSPGYGFTAIIVAFVGRLNPVAIVFAGVLVALSYLGGEAAQISLRLSEKMARVFQGVLLFYVLACNTLVHNRIRLVRSPRSAPVAGGEVTAPAEVSHGNS